MDTEARDRLLDAIARGVRSVATRDRDRTMPGVDLMLWRVEVALLDADGDTLRVSGLADVLGWVVDRQHQCSDARDTRLDVATDAHVFVHEERCREPGCGEKHRDPCAECGRTPGEGAGDGCDTCDRLRRESNGESEDDGDATDREDTIRASVGRLARERVVALLTGAGIQCYDHEDDATLSEALVVNVMDGTIDESDLGSDS